MQCGAPVTHDRDPNRKPLKGLNKHGTASAAAKRTRRGWAPVRPLAGRPMPIIAIGISGTRGQAASFSLALALIIAAPFSAIMIVGALVFVELTAGITEASMMRSVSSPWTRSWSSTTDMP